jgi:hypothetical protein
VVVLSASLAHTQIPVILITTYGRRIAISRKQLASTIIIALLSYSMRPILISLEWERRLLAYDGSEALD